ncbi:MAG: hypothetical protein V4722_12165 [Bacteroidota bacterium]
MFANPKNRSKLISFLIAFTLVILTTFFVNQNKKESEQISGKIAGIDKKMEASLSLYLLAKSDFSYAMLYQTLGMLHKENGHSFNTVFLPYGDALIRGIKSINEAIGQNEGRVEEETIGMLENGFKTAADRDNLDDFFKTFSDAGRIVTGLNYAYETNVKKLANDKLSLKAERAALEVRASLLTWIAAIIGFVQLFFNSFYDMYIEYKKSSNTTLRKI